MENKSDKLGGEALHETESQTTFKGKVNKYAFIHLDKSLREAWGITRGTEQPVTIEITAEGALIIRKA